MSDRTLPVKRIIARLDGVWKKYNLRQELPDTVREQLASVFRRDRVTECFWALRDVSLDVHRGETIGIIGANGSGKTTVLKLLAGITACTQGEVRVGGRCGVLIELGAGFHPELTGRDNIFLNGSILGLTRKEVKQRYSTIVDFAELHRFIDTPVKYYSSGMAMRLGFAIAVNIDADLLLVDEALSVGDRSFQDKCIDRIMAMKQEGRTFVVVSHSMEMIEQICTRAVWLDSGVIRADGQPKAVIDNYLTSLDHNF